MNAPEPTTADTTIDTVDDANVPRLRRSVLGIRRADAAEEMARLDAKIARLHEKIDDYERTLAASKSTIGAQEDELRYLRGRQVRIDEQYRTANAEAARLVARARRTAESLVSDAQSEARSITEQVAISARDIESRRREVERHAQRSAHAIAAGIAEVERALSILRESMTITTGGHSSTGATTLLADTTSEWEWPSDASAAAVIDANGAPVASAEGDIATTNTDTAITPLTLIAHDIGDYIQAQELEQRIAALPGVRDVYLRALEDDEIELAIDASVTANDIATAIAAEDGGSQWTATVMDDNTITAQAATEPIDA